MSDPEPTTNTLPNLITNVNLSKTLDIPAYISAQIPLLTSLHTQLALPPSALTDDLYRIDSAVRAAITSIVRSREEEVVGWEERINDQRRSLAALARAVGERGREVVVVRRESGECEPLPIQHARLLRQAEDLEQVYNERLSKVEALIATVERLSALLGPPFEPPKPLQPIPGSSSSNTSTATSLNRNRLSSTITSTNSNVTSVQAATHIAPTINKRHSGRGAGVIVTVPNVDTEVAQRSEVWYDVGESVVEELEMAVQNALVERNIRLRNLETSFNDLIWYHAELDLPPFGSSSSSSNSSRGNNGFPSHLLVSKELEEQPGDHDRYAELLGEIMAINLVPTDEEGDEGVEIQGMEGVEPEIGLIAYTEALLDLWVNEKNKRDAKIQQLYEKIEPLWSRLDIPQETIDQFIETNRGSGETTIRAYEEELERVLEIRRTSLSSFVVGVRKEIAALQDTLMMSEDEKGEFGAFINDDFSEELLKEHEDEAERLRIEVELKSSLLPRVKEWFSLKEDEEELERSANDPNRFKKRGTAMLKEEKMRKRVEKLKPKIEAELLETLPIWEEENSRLFIARGDRVVDTINDALAAKEAAKEAKRLAKLGLTPTSAAAHYATPAPPSRATYLGVGGGLTSRKREAPTPSCVIGTNLGAKRQRVASASATVSSSGKNVIPSSTVRPRVASATALGYSGGVGNRGTTTTMKMMNPPGTVTRSGSITLPSPMMNTPTPIGFGGGSSSLSTSSLHHQPQRLTVVGKPTLSIFGTSTKVNVQPQQQQQLQRQGVKGQLQKSGVENVDAIRKINRRQSFKPRQSVAGGLLMARAAGGGGVEIEFEDGRVVEEEEDVF